MTTVSSGQIVGESRAGHVSGGLGERVCAPAHWGVLGWILSLVLLVCSGAVGRAEAAPNMDAGVNRTVPKVTPPATRVAFSATPTDVDFLHTGLFSEPLAPVAGTTVEENRDLARALLAYRDAIRKTGANDAVDPILTFVAAHPDSAWKPVLQLDLGIVYRQTGHFSKALEIWQTGWNESKGLTDPRGQTVANALAARLSQLEAYLGRKELLQPLLDSIKPRSVGGTSEQLITDSNTGLYDMLHHPEDSFRCGPLALTRIATFSSTKPSPAALKVLDEAHSTDHGLSLTMVQEIATKAAMEYQMAFRSPGAAVLKPAVAHWKVGHYAAIVDKADGRFVVQDSTFGEDIRVSPGTLDEEASGYFLVRAGALPKGWRRVPKEEGDKVWGRGNTGQNHDNGATGNPCSGGGGCTSPAVEPEVVGLQLNDEPVGYTPPVGPAVRFHLVYSHRDAEQPTTGFPYTNFGPKWTLNWLSYITVGSTSSVLYRRGGGTEPYMIGTSSTGSATGPYSTAVMDPSRSSSGVPNGFTITNPDGSFEQFNQPNAAGNEYFMTAVGDAAGNKVTLTYDSQMRIVAITDAIGQVSTLTYGLTSNPTAVTKITDPFGRSATFTYTADGHLGSITDTLGITSSYTYGQALAAGTDPDFINTLTTPYGTTTFTFGDVNTNANLGATRFLRTVDPLGRASYVEFNQSVDAGDTSGGFLKNGSLMPSVTGMMTCNQYLNFRNTFIFDANQYALATQGGGLNYSLAHVIHWLHTSDGQAASRFMESEKQPLENRVWYNYPSQPSCIFAPVSNSNTVTSGASINPTFIARVLDNGATQVHAFTYNPQGNVLTTKDPVGRQLTFTYAANNIDRLTIKNTTFANPQLLETRTYNGQHLPLTITGANGKPARYQYNAAGQLSRYTDPLGHSTALSYDASGRVKTIQGPLTGAQYSLSYDLVSRVAAVTDQVGATVHLSYDNADRRTSVTYPDSTNTQFGYNLLDLVSVTDRLGQTTAYTYDADRELTKTTDALGNNLQWGFNPAGVLTSITDASSHTTTLVLDAESRLVSKQYPDGTLQSIMYESSISLPALITDALYQVTTYSYNLDNSVANIGYNSNQPTASVSFSYDPAYLRLLGMTDGAGTTTYSYYPVSSSVLGANRLQSVTSPIPGASGSDTVSYTYDALDRVVGSTIDGVAQSISFDALGRTTSHSNALDTFTYSYADATQRVTGISSNRGPISALSYFGPQGDETLQQLSVTAQGGSALAQLGYARNSDGNLTSSSESTPAVPATSYAYTYDATNRLKNVLVGAAPTSTYAYGYDAASNLTSITANGTQQSLSYTATNSLSSGTYDANGSPTALGGNTYTWDGANRIASVSGAANNTSNFTYDGLGRLVRVVDMNNGSVVADHSYLWCGMVRCLAHDNTQSGSPVSAQYFPQGMIANGTPYYYVRDNLSSVRQLITTGGSVAAQYDYDPYGNPTTVSGTLVSDIGYAGYFYHPASGLNFALYRAYDPSRGRWLNRDPIGEAGGIDLYAYADGNPVSNSDPLGLFVTSVDAACFVDPDFCAEVFGQIAHNAADISGDACLEEAADAVSGALKAAAEVAEVLQVVHGIPEDIGPYSSEASGEVGPSLMPKNIGPYSSKAPRQVAPGVKTVEGHYVNDMGRVEPYRAHYDEYGRQVGRTDYNAGNRAAGIPDTHYHVTEYNDEYPLGHSGGDHLPGEYPE